MQMISLGEDAGGKKRVGGERARTEVRCPLAAAPFTPSTPPRPPAAPRVCGEVCGGVCARVRENGGPDG